MMEALLSKKRWNLAAGDDEKQQLNTPAFLGRNGAPKKKNHLQFLDPNFGESVKMQKTRANVSIYL